MSASHISYHRATTVELATSEKGDEGKGEPQVTLVWLSVNPASSIA